jgi:tryptophan-rich sensory protein
VAFWLYPAVPIQLQSSVLLDLITFTILQGARLEGLTRFSQVLPPIRKPKFKVRKPGWTPQSWMIFACWAAILFLLFVIALARFL